MHAWTNRYYYLLTGFATKAEKTVVSDSPNTGGKLTPPHQKKNTPKMLKRHNLCAVFSFEFIKRKEPFYFHY